MNSPGAQYEAEWWRECHLLMEVPPWPGESDGHALFVHPLVAWPAREALRAYASYYLTERSALGRGRDVDWDGEFHSLAYARACGVAGMDFRQATGAVHLAGQCRGLIRRLDLDYTTCRRSRSGDIYVPAGLILSVPSPS